MQQPRKPFRHRADGIGVVVSQVSPSLFSAASDILQDYQRVMNKMGIKNWSFASIAGFINAKIMVDALKRAGRNVTRASLVDALESMMGASCANGCTGGMASY